jgi:hypothetical protein
MSGFRPYIRDQLKRKKRSWAKEWDGVFKDDGVDDTLKRAERLGADPEFCIFVLAHYRWREFRPARPQWLRARLLTAVTTLLNLEGDWAQVLGRRGPDALGSHEVQRFLAKAHVGLRWVRALDEGAFSTTVTEKDQRGWEKERQSTCLSVLRRHILHASEPQKGPRKKVPQTILLELLSDFGLLPATSRNLRRLIEKRRERMDRNQRFPLLPLYGLYHDLHLAAGIPRCTRACQLRFAVKDLPKDPTHDREHVLLASRVSTTTPQPFADRNLKNEQEKKGRNDA